MVVIKEVKAESIKDSRRDKTISITISCKIENNIKKFSSSAPNGKSKGKKESKPYKKNLEGDIKTLNDFSDYFSTDEIEKFEDLRRIEDIVDRHIGANSLFALESAILKALANEEKKQVWELIPGSSKKNSFPGLVGNTAEGGKHSDGPKKSNKKPDFQEFQFITKTKSIKEAFELNKKLKQKIKTEIKEADKNFTGKTTDEKGWKTSLNDRQVIGLLSKVTKDKPIKIGVDVAASSFYKRKKYTYQNPPLKRIPEEHYFYIKNLIENFGIYYIEDPFEEEDFSNHGKLLKEFPNSLIVGDDLIVTNIERLKKAIKTKSINALIVKPNQNGSLLKVAEICKIAKENKIKTVFSHRSGETQESILADLAFGFKADFFKCGIDGKEREAKLKRLVEIEKSLE
ncbi:MAG: hypothetical protein ACOCUU_02320 [Nanoarchaeota archaeon]